MRNMIQLLGGVAVAGVVAAGSTAFTANGGITLGGSNGATANTFIGGTVSQTVTGATVTDVAYTHSDPAKTLITSVLLTFADATGGKTPTITTTGLTTSDSAAWTCAAIHATLFTSNCTHSGNFDGGRLSALNVTVS